MRLSAPADPTAPPAPVSVSDEALVEHLRNGSPSAGEELVRRLGGPLMQYLKRLARDEYLAEELHQQTWLSALDHIDRFNSANAGGFKAWIFRIATNKANDHWRKTGRGKAAYSGLRLVTDEIGPDSSAGLEATEEQIRMRAAIEKLPEPQKQVVLMRYYGNLKFVEIAEALGCPLNTALGRMHKAMIKLKELME